MGPRCSRYAVRGDQFYATAGQVGIQAVRLVGVVTDETHRERLDKPLREGCVDQGDFVRRGTLDVNRDRESAAIGESQLNWPSRLNAIAREPSSLTSYIHYSLEGSDSFAAAAWAR